MSEPNEVTGGILAGGRGLRMGGRDKGLIEVRGQLLVERTCAQLRPQVAAIAISANRNLDRYQQFGFPLYSDTAPGFLGPLAGIATLLAETRTTWLVTVPCDTPGFPVDLVARLLQAQRDSAADAVVVHDGEQRQFLFALYRSSLADSAARALEGGERAVWRWQEKLKIAECVISDSAAAFSNLNSESDLS